MEESFKARVKRLFGSRLFETVPKSSFPGSSWSVTDGEVEKREWNWERGGAHPGREDEPCASAFDECFPRYPRRGRSRKKLEDDLGDMEGGDEEEEEEEEKEGGGGGGDEGDDLEREEREIRGSVGLDSTLDHEEEEDEYDRAAFCRENVSERVYMRDVTDHGPHLNYNAIVSDLLEDSSEEVHPILRDPRADHLAASVRLKEDKEAGGSSHPRPISSDGMSHIKITEGDVNLKPILKRKAEQNHTRPKKHVRFDPGCKDHDEESVESQDLLTVPQSTKTTRVAEASGMPSEDSPGVPDYLRNPSKYVCYTFDSLEEDYGDESNRRTFEEFRSTVRTSNSVPSQPESTTEPPKSVTYIPRRQTVDAMATDDSSGVNHEYARKESARVLIQSVGIAAGEGEENQACAMEEDSIETPVGKSDGFRKSGRQYRSKASSDDSAS